MYEKKQMQEIKNFAMEMPITLADKNYYSQVDDLKLAQQVSKLTISIQNSHITPLDIYKIPDRIKAKSKIEALLKKGYTMYFRFVTYKSDSSYCVTFLFQGPEKLQQKKLARIQSGDIVGASKVPFEIYFDFIVPIGELSKFGEIINSWAK